MQRLFWCEDLKEGQGPQSVWRPLCSLVLYSLAFFFWWGRTWNNLIVLFVIFSKGIIRQCTKTHKWGCSSDFFPPNYRESPEKAMAPHSSTPTWRIPGTGEPGGLPSMGSHRVRHDWSDLAAAAAGKVRNNSWVSDWVVVVLLAQLCLILCSPMDCSLPGSCVHGILQARILTGVDFHALLQRIFLIQG